jgi:3-hydroxyisobutyrate dehydrogenase-like beta-hydroxyacid dehydrogenase
VAGWDPAAVSTPAGVARVSGAVEAVSASDIVLSVTSARAAVAVAEECTSALTGVELYADLNTAAPAAQVAIAGVVGRTGVPFADVALLAPVPLHGIRTPALVSGPGAGAFADRFRPLGMPVEVLGSEAGLAAQRKLLRSVFMKGLAAAIGESLDAAAALGCAGWLHDEIASTLETADVSLVDRLVDGSRLHAGRRLDEMTAACEMLRGLGVEPRVAAAAAARLEMLAGAR